MTNHVALIQFASGLWFWKVLELEEGSELQVVASGTAWTKTGCRFKIWRAKRKIKNGNV